MAERRLDDPFGVDPFADFGFGEFPGADGYQPPAEEPLGTSPLDHPNAPENGGGITGGMNPPPAPTYGREEWRDIWMERAGGASNIGDIEGILAEIGGSIEDPRSGKIRTPHGELIDGIFDADGQGFRGGMWTGTFDPKNPGAWAGMQASGQVGGGASGGAGSGSGSSSKSGLFGDDLMNALRGLFPGGMFNQGIVNQRVDLARDTLNRQRQSQGSQNRAALAARGLIGDGVEGGTQARLEDRLYDQFSNSVGGIFADESENADQRMMSALQTAAGMSTEDAKTAVDWFNAGTNRDLGFGNLGLGHKRADNDKTLGLGNLALGNARLGFDYDSLDADDENADLDRLVKVIDQLYRGADQSAGGFN